jgi:hypothetical protein
MIAPMKMSAALTHATAPEFKRVDEFVTSLGSAGIELDAADQRKLRDLCTDIGELRLRDLAGNGAKVGWAGYLFSWFEAIIAARSTDAAARDQRRRLRVHTDTPSFAAFAPDLADFDRLSIFYGNRYRFSLLLNYVFGALAVFVSLIPVVVGEIYGSPHAPLWVNVTFGLVEFGLVATICITYLRGRTPEYHGGVGWAWPRVWRRWWPWAHSGERWHERWLEYRVLAERFRYLEILYPVVEDVGATWRTANGGRKASDWVDRYFEWRITAVKPDEPEFDGYLARLSAVMSAQMDYHRRSAAKRELVYERLHLSAYVLFGATLVAVAIHIGVYLAAGLSRHGEPWPYWALLLFVTGAAPALGAAIHGFLSSGEYAKLVQISTEMVKRIGEIDVAIKSVAPQEVHSREDLAVIRKSVEAFFLLVVDEASGWKAMFRDKNVPLG